MKNIACVHVFMCHVFIHLNVFVMIIKVTNVYVHVPKTNITTYMDKIILINIELLFVNEHTREDYLEMGTMELDLK
jgi:hypothetical protein